MRGRSRPIASESRTFTTFGTVEDYPGAEIKAHGLEAMLSASGDKQRIARLDSDPLVTKHGHHPIIVEWQRLFGPHEDAVAGHNDIQLVTVVWDLGVDALRRIPT